MSEIDMVIKELEEEEREKNNLNPKTERAPRKLLKEKLHIYIYSKRMLCTYKNCGCCEKEMTNTKVLLNNIFPAENCNEICNYNILQPLLFQV